MKEEETLIQRLKDGEEKAINELYQSYAELVYNTALSYVQSIPDAEEVAKDVFIKVYWRIKSFK